MILKGLLILQCAGEVAVLTEDAYHPAAQATARKRISEHQKNENDNFPPSGNLELALI